MRGRLPQGREVAICAAALVLALNVAGCGHSPSGPSDVEAVVTGTVSYRERIAVPADAVAEITLLDVSRQDIAAPVLARTSVTFGGRQVPLPFRLVYDRGAIEPTHVYAVRATIRVDGQLWFTTNTVTRVITQGHPSSVDLLLIGTAVVSEVAATRALTP